MTGRAGRRFDGDSATKISPVIEWKKAEIADFLFFTAQPKLETAK